MRGRVKIILAAVLLLSPHADAVMGCRIAPITDRRLFLEEMGASKIVKATIERVEPVMPSPRQFKDSRLKALYESSGNGDIPRSWIVTLRVRSAIKGEAHQGEEIKAKTSCAVDIPKTWKTIIAFIHDEGGTPTLGHFAVASARSGRRDKSSVEAELRSEASIAAFDPAVAGPALDWYAVIDSTSLPRMIGLMSNDRSPAVRSAAANKAAQLKSAQNPKR